jgi:hypothetical protein
LNLTGTNVKAASLREFRQLVVRGQIAIDEIINQIGDGSDIASQLVAVLINPLCLGGDMFGNVVFIDHRLLNATD